MVPSNEEGSFQPPSMVCISVIVYFTHYKFSMDLCAQLPCSALYNCSLFRKDAPELNEGLEDVIRVGMSLPRDLTSSSLLL